MTAVSEPRDASNRAWNDLWARAAAPGALLLSAGIYFLISGNRQVLMLTGFGLMVYGLIAMPIFQQALVSTTLRMLDWPANSNSGQLGEWIRALLPVFVALLIIGAMGVLAQDFKFFGTLLSIGCYGLLAVTIGGVLSAIDATAEARKQRLYSSGLAMILGCIAWFATPPAYASRHPIFQTPVTRVSVNRPAVHVIVKDDRELGGFDTAELYLAVQSSRFPSGVQVLLPINRGDFRGCMQRFIQLPFEVEIGDNLSFELIDDNQLTPEQEQTILLACKAGGYCVRFGNAILAPELDWIVAPSADVGSEVIAAATVMSFQGNPFRNFGGATFIVESSKPTTPNAANPIDLLDRSNYSRAAVKVYYPTRPLAALSESAAR